MNKSIGRGKLQDNSVWSFIFAGKAIFTVQSPNGTHKTFKVLKVQGEGYDRPIWTVMALVGPDNNSNYRRIGYMIGDPAEKKVYFKGAKNLPANHALIQAFVWILGRAEKGEFSTKSGTAHVYHEGRCGRCGRRLTVPASIHRGLGPHCALQAFQEISNIVTH